MTKWEDIICKAKEFVDATSQKVTDVTEVTKQKLKIAENERAIRVALEALGGLMYDSRKENIDLNEELVAELIAQVDELTTANDQLQAEVDHRRSCKTCSCGEKNPEYAAYCSACGQKL